MRIFRKALRCSFCRRDESQVAKLVAGPRVYICDRCAYETIRIMESTPPPAASRAKRASIQARLFGEWRPPQRELETAEAL